MIEDGRSPPASKYGAHARPRDRAALGGGTVASVMSHPLITVDVGVSLEQASARMGDEGVHHLLLTDRGHVVALVSDRNLIRALGLGPSQRDTDSRYRRHPVLQVASY